MRSKPSFWYSVLAVLILLDVFGPALLGAGDPPLWLHHLEHAFLLAAGGGFGVLYARRHPKPYGDPGWLFAVIGLSAASLLLMLPDVYGNVDAFPVLHSLLHLAFVGIGYVGGYTAERYSPRSGVAWTLIVVMMGVITATGFGAPGPHV